MYHRITILGRIGSDGAELRYTPQGTAVANFSLAADSGYGENRTTIWFRCTAWGKTAESASEYLTKGIAILVEGELKPDPTTGGPRIWQDSSGNARASFELTAEKWRFAERKAKSSEEPEEENDMPF